MLLAMGLTWKDVALWIAGFSAFAALFAVLIGKKRARQFPFFTTLIGFDALQNIVLFLLLKDQGLYSYAFWIGQAIEFVLQIAVVVEIARQVFRPFGRWASGARSFWVAACGISLVAALGLTFVASPHAPTYTWAWVIKGKLFAIMLTCMISIAVLVTARQYGLAWRNHVIGLAQGWTMWAFITFVVETFHSYLGYTTLYQRLQYIGDLANLVALGFWIFIFWQEEPSRVVSPERHKFLVEQQRQLGYYVDKLVSRSDSRRSS
jgi:hypothetical protein